MKPKNIVSRTIDGIRNFVGGTYWRQQSPSKLCGIRVRGFGGWQEFQCSKEQVLAIPAFFSGVRIIANTISSQPLRLVERETNAPVENTPLARLLQSPNEQDTLYDLLQYTICDLLLSGIAYVIIDRKVNGTQLRLNYVPYANVEYMGNFDERPSYNVTYEGGSKAYEYRDVIRFVNNFFDCSSLLYYAPAVQLADLLIKNNINYFRNSARPGLIFKYPAEVSLTEEERSEHIQSIIDTYSNDDGKFTPIIADRGLEVDSMDINFQNAQVLEQREFIVKEVARLLNIPLSKLGVMGNTKSSVSEENNHFIHHTLRPIATILESKLNKYLLTDISIRRYRFKFDFNELLYGSLKDKASAFRINADLGIFSKEELREIVYGLSRKMPEDDEPAAAPNTQSQLIGENTEGEGGDPTEGDDTNADADEEESANNDDE